jgi:hypothetical protein
MLTKTKIAFAAVLVLGSALLVLDNAPASAAPRWRDSQAIQPAGTGSKYGPRCTASGGPECYTGCQGANPTGAPCKEEHDGW